MPAVGELPDSGVGDPKLRKSGHRPLDRDDLMLIAALQAMPRAPWNSIGAQAGMSSSTAARRWARLQREGVAWISAYPAARVATTAYCWIDVAPDSRASVTGGLAARPEVYWVERIDGEASFFLAVAGPTPREVEDLVADIATQHGVRGVRMQLCRSVLHDGSRWVPHRSAPIVVADELVWRARPSGAVPTPTGIDLQLYEALMDDGRMSYRQLADRAGVSERTVRRRLTDLVDKRAIVARCDVAREALGYDVGFLVAARWNRRWRSLVGVAARMPATRLVAGLSGETPLLFHFWGRSVADADAILARLESVAPDLDIVRLDVTTRAVKRFGRVFGEDGRVSGHAAAIPYPRRG